MENLKCLYALSLCYEKSQISFFYDTNFEYTGTLLPLLQETTEFQWLLLGIILDMQVGWLLVHSNYSRSESLYIPVVFIAAGRIRCIIM